MTLCRVLLLSLLLTTVPAQAELRLSHTFDSAALGGPMKYSVYLPPGYATEPQQHYPVVYLLHGVGDNELTWPRRGQVAATLDRLIAEGELPPMIAVMPDLKTSWLADSKALGGPGDYATATGVDLLQHIDATYRTRANRSGRAIAGNSMGGFGALKLAFTHPDRYAAVAGLSSALWLRLEDDSTLNERQEKIFQGSFGTPFDAARFRRQSPIARINALKDLQQPLAIYLTAGDDDVFRAYNSTTELYGLLRNAEIKAELRIEDGAHTWDYWARALPGVLRFFADEFARQQPDLAVRSTSSPK